VRAILSGIGTGWGVTIDGTRQYARAYPRSNFAVWWGFWQDTGRGPVLLAVFAKEINLNTSDALLTLAYLLIASAADLNSTCVND